MSLSPAPSTNAEPLFAREYAVRIGTVLLVAFAAIIALTGYDESRRDKLETFEEMTAVGDRNFFPIPKELQKPHPAAVTFQGKPLFPVSYEPVKANDPEMTRVGVAEGAAFRIYKSQEPLERGDEPTGADSYYLKLERDRYLEVRPGSPGK